MKELKCKNCGSTELREENGYQKCEYCGAQFLITAEDKPIKDTVLNLKADVDLLLAKCKEEPERATKIAERILELDPDNQEAITILSSNDSNNNGGCYIATAVYGSYDCPEVWTLRRYRDFYLSRTRFGRVFIHAYYAISPKLVRCFGKTRWFKSLWKKYLDTLVASLNEKGLSNTYYEDKYWQ